MSKRKTIRRLAVAAGLCFAVGLSGCERRPQAPVLRDSPVYRNNAEGLRFLVPDGWIQTASTLLPEGQLGGQAFLVRYRINTPEPGAMLQIECAPDGPDVDLAEHHAAPSYRVERWTASGPSQSLTIGGAEAVRLIYTGEVAGRKMTKEVVCFRRRGRIYSFVGLFWATDDKAREQIRRAVESTIWDR
jgi:hypothetical protein